MKDSLYSKSTEQVNGDYGIEMKKPVKARADGEGGRDGGWTINAVDTRNSVDVVKKTVGGSCTTCREYTPIHTF